MSLVSSKRSRRQEIEEIEKYLQYTQTLEQAVNNASDLVISCGGTWTASMHNELLKDNYSALWQPEKAKCPYCGNASGLKEKRGGCISCGGMF